MRRCRRRWGNEEEDEVGMGVCVWVALVWTTGTDSDRPQLFCSAPAERRGHPPAGSFRWQEASTRGTPTGVRGGFALEGSDECVLAQSTPYPPPHAPLDQCICVPLPHPDALWTAPPVYENSLPTARDAVHYTLQRQPLVSPLLLHRGGYPPPGCT